MFRRYLSLFAHDPSVVVDSESDFVQYIFCTHGFWSLLKRFLIPNTNFVVVLEFLKTCVHSWSSVCLIPIILNWII